MRLVYIRKLSDETLADSESERKDFSTWQEIEGLRGGVLMYSLAEPGD